jgi:hypothetical protein
VADVACVAGSAAEGAACQDQAPTYACGDDQADHVRAASAGASPVFAQCHADAVACQFYRDAWEEFGHGGA